MAGGNNILLKRDDMVTFFRLPSNELDNLDMVKGQLIFTYDNAALYFDVPNWNKQSEEDPDLVRVHCDGVKFNLTREGQYLILTSQDDPSVYQRVKLPSYTFTPDNSDKHLITIHCDDGTEDVVLDTRYTASDGVTLTGYNFTNSGVRDVTTGDQNGTIKINKNGTISNVPVYGLGTAAFANKGVAGGVAELDNSGLVPSSQLPSYVDDVIEGYYYEDKFYSDAAHTTEITGETGKIYVDLDTGRSFRWSGSVYIVVGDKIQSDWSINDSTQDAYVKNRTHYKEGNVAFTDEYDIIGGEEDSREELTNDNDEVIGYRYKIYEMVENFDPNHIKDFDNKEVTFTIKNINYNVTMHLNYYIENEETFYYLEGTFENGIGVRIRYVENYRPIFIVWSQEAGTMEYLDSRNILEINFETTLENDNIFNNEGGE